MCLKPESISWHEDFSDWRDRNKFLLEKMYMSDCSFVVQKGTTQVIVPAHKYILGGFSLDFFNLFYRMEANSDQIPITDVSVAALKEFLKFVYTGERTLNMEIVWDVLKLAVRYNSKILKAFCESFIIRRINERNCLFVLDKCSAFGMTFINSVCIKSIEKNSVNFLKTPAFLDISQDTLNIILKSNNLTISEIELYRVVLKWTENNCVKNNNSVNTENMRLALGSAISNIRFASMNIKEFSECSDNNSILTHKEINQIYRFIGTDGKSDCPFPSVKRSAHKKICYFSNTPRQRIFRKGFTCYFPFSVEKKIKFYGFGIYGRAKISDDFLNPEVLHYQLVDQYGHTVLSSSAKIHYDGTEKVYDLVFDRYAYLKPFQQYTVYINRNVPGVFLNYYEGDMMKRVVHNGVVFRQRFDWSIVATIIFE